VPEGVRSARSRYVQETPVVWQPKEQNDKAVFYYLHVVLRNASRTDIAEAWGNVILLEDPEVAAQCTVQSSTSSANPALRAGQSLPMFCATDWQKKVSLQSLIDASRAVEAGRSRMVFRPHLLRLHGSDFDLQRSGRTYYKREFRTMGFYASGRSEAAAIVRASSCLDRGSCADEFLGGFGPFLGFAWVAFAAGVFAYLVAAAVARRLWLRARTMWIITAVATLPPILGFALALGDSRAGLGILFVPVIGGHLWAAFAAGLWGAWLLALPFRRRAAPQSLGR